MNNKKGKVNLANSIASANLFSLFSNPGANRFIMVGIKISNNMIKGKRKLTIKVDISDKNISPFFAPSFILIPDTSGTNAEFIAPSANNLLNKLGNLNATKKASET